MIQEQPCDGFDEIEPIPSVAQMTLDAALACLQSGFAVFPCWNVYGDGRCACGAIDCQNVGKHPQGHLAPHGPKNATRDTERVRQLWLGSPFANPAIATGTASGGLVVVDVDAKPGRDGGPVVAGWERKYGPLDTFTVKTGSGGRHYYFLSPQRFRSSSDRVAAGIDVRAEGGYVIAPGARNRSGEYVIVNARDPQPLPPWMAKLLDSAPIVHSGKPVLVTPDPPIADGTRTRTLLAMAGAMRRAGMSPAGIEAGLLAENETRCAPRLPVERIEGIACWFGAKPAASAGLTGGELCRLTRSARPTIEKVRVRS